ncbi:Bacteroides conjugative transposon TraM protein [Mucilaginibacter pineti]|uniref:Bacteroides conjugative transposon TraM protein n=1 Tax=Mucilaginibacter pineti TaxID=1391627 RepID=A0A1G7N6M0_9SPHI|nr:conjugative transposon protein TraM [Mucilaginibacter pineti]SDF69705.1 Bacteroides conjugative transposon TraM protein [Mucilaginibacter pineti]
MKINFKQPKYILPLILLPFLCLFFFVYHSSQSKKQVQVKKAPGMQDNVGAVSAAVQQKELSDKLDAYRNTYKQADGYTALAPIGEEKSTNAGFGNQYSSREKRLLDSVDQAMKQKYHSGTDPSGNNGAPLPYTSPPPLRHNNQFKEDKALAQALANLSGQPHTPPKSSAPVRQKDPMELFKAQMAYADSMSRANDPAYKAEQQKKAAIAALEATRSQQPKLAVSKADDLPDDFNTIYAHKTEGFIMAIIDENLTGYAGSRIRLRLLEDIRAGHTLVKRGTYLYALINGFSQQRVTLVVPSIMYGTQVLPVKLEVYDQDGLPGLYVPESAFRDFTKDLSGNSMQGINIQSGSADGNQFLMSTLDKMFQSTSSAIASAIRKNKAKIKYNSYIYLIDPQALQNAQKNY